MQIIPHTASGAKAPFRQCGILAPVRVLLVVSGNKYTGAAAAAEHTCRALGAVGVDARLLYVAGNNLQQRLDGVAWAVPGLHKDRSPARLARNLATLRSEAAAASAVIAHLPHDHFLCLAARVASRAPLLRSYRNPRHLRRDPYQRLLTRPLAAALLAHSELAPALAALRPGLPHLALPVPLEDRFQPGGDGTAWRRRLEIPEHVPVLGMIGKVAPGRGFDLLLETATRAEPSPHVLVIGHGEARPALEALAQSLGLGGRVHWAGYQEDDLPALYAAIDVVLVPAAGSDHGHRAISEAQGCARPVVAAALPGVGDLVEDGRTGLIRDSNPAGLAEAVSGLLGDTGARVRMGEAAAAAVAPRRFEPAGRTLREFIEEVVRG